MRNSFSVRITSGQLRNLELQTPGGATHPMGARERLALFNMLNSYVDFEEVDVYDFYAGAGTLGIEAISRGANSCTFVDASYEAITAIKNNIRKCQIDELVKVVKSKINPDLKLEDEGNQKLILLDPPYDGFHEDEFSWIFETFAKPGDVIAISYPSSFRVDNLNAELQTERKYAACNIAIFVK